MARIAEWHDKNASKSTEGAKNGLKREKPTIRQDPAHEESESWRMKVQKPFHVARGQEWVAECIDMTLGHGKHMSSSQALNTHESGARTRLRHHQPIPSQYRSGGPCVRGKRGDGLGEPILGFLLKLFWGKCPVGMTYHPKEGKMSWNHYVHAMRDSERECPPLSGWECHGE